MTSIKTLLILVFMLVTACQLSTHDIYSEEGWSAIGPGGGGWIPAITILNDSKHTIIVGCDVGGVYKSTDNGQSWEIKNKGLSMYFVQDIAYDPDDTNILYLANRGGIYKSINGGDSWELKDAGLPSVEEFLFSAPINDIAVDPNNPNILYAGVGVHKNGYDFDSYHWDTVKNKGVIYKSLDWGDTWSAIHDTGINIDAMIYSLAINPKDSNTIYAATDKGIYKSSDGGGNWAQKKSGLPKLKVMNIVIDSKNPETVYATLWVEPGSSGWKGGVYKSTNGGNSWKAKNNGLPKEVGDESGFTSNFTTMVIDNNNPNNLYVGNMPWTPDPGVYRTTDGGDSWTWVTRADVADNKNMELAWIPDAGVSPMSLAIDPVDGSRLVFGTSMHLFKTENRGDSWKQIHSKSQGGGYWSGAGFETTCVQTITVDPSNSSNVYGGYWDIGFQKSIDGGKSFKKIENGMKYKDNTFDIIVDPDSPNVIYASCGWWEENKGEVYKSTDFGESWTPLNNGIPDAQIWSIALDTKSPKSSRILYAGSYDHGVYKTVDGGKHWKAINKGLGVSKNLQVRKIYIDPNNSNTLYAGIEVKHIEYGDSTNTIQGGLFKSINGGKSWKRVDTGSPQISVWDIAIPKGNSGTVYTAVSTDYDHSKRDTFYGGVYKSIDKGESFIRMGDGFGDRDNLDVSALAINPEDSSVIYAATTDAPFHDLSSGRGIFKSSNSGESWESISDESEVLYFSAIEIDPLNPRVIYGGSAGNGILKGMME